MMNKSKNIIIIAIVAVVYIAFSIFISNVFKDNNKYYIFIGNTAKWMYNKSWYNITDNMASEVDLSTLKVYDILLGDYVDNNLTYAGNIKTIDEDGNYNAIDDTYLLIKGNDKTKIVSYTYSDFTSEDDARTTQVLKDLNFNNYNEISSKSKISIDLNNDGINDDIYAISNMYSEKEETTYFSVLYVYIGSKSQVLVKTTTTSTDLLEKEQNDVYAIVDLLGDNKYELITSTSGFSLSGTTKYTMFKLKNGKYESLINS